MLDQSRANIDIQHSLKLLKSGRIRLQTHPHYRHFFGWETVVVFAHNICKIGDSVRKESVREYKHSESRCYYLFVVLAMLGLLVLLPLLFNSGSSSGGSYTYFNASKYS